MSHRAKILVVDVDRDRSIDAGVKGRWEILRAQGFEDGLRLAETSTVFAVICGLQADREVHFSFFNRLRTTAAGARLFVIDHGLELDEVIQAINDFQIDRLLPLPLDVTDLVKHLENAHEQFEVNGLDFTRYRLGISDVNRRVLCVDDDDDLLRFYQDVLTTTCSTALTGQGDRWSRRASATPDIRDRTGTVPEPVGLEVITVSSGERAVRLVHEAITDGRPFAAGFFDMHMPYGLDGLETLRRLRAIDPNMMCAVVTGYSDRNLTDIQAVFADSVDWIYFDKPFSVTGLEQAALNLVSGWNQRRRAESMERLSAKLRYLLYKNRYMFSALDVENMIGTVCLKTVFDVLDADGCTLLLREPGTRRLRPLVHRGTGTGQQGLAPVISSWAERECPAQILDLEIADPDTAAMLRGLQVRSLLIVPVSSDRGLVGVITAALAEGPRRFRKEDLEILRLLADHIETALQSCSHIEDLRWNRELMGGAHPEPPRF